MPNEGSTPAVAPPTAPPFVSAFSRTNSGGPVPDTTGALHALTFPTEVIARITTEPRLPPFTVKWSWNSGGLQLVNVQHRAWIFYNEHGRNDMSGVITQTTSTLDVMYDFGSLIQGGVLDARCVVNWRNPQTGEQGAAPEAQQLFSVRGDNPTKSDIRTLLPSLPLQVITYKESRFRQFDNACLPLFGPPRGFGVMQLDTPPPTATQLWNWRENIAGGIALYTAKQHEVERHFNNFYAAHPEAPRLTNDQVKASLYQYFNGGWYWEWDPASRAWKKVGNTAYGDDAIRIEQLVVSGHPPADW